MKQYHVYQLEYFDLLAQASSRRQVVCYFCLLLDLSKHWEETLNYLKSTFNIDKIKTIQCTQEVTYVKFFIHQLT
ncbi:unnamed protein product [Rotaria sp. Silwood1]|nr:unnamed protein product [Rotaria sp. Silwood1]CAF5154945.1 unnamed protein product [Rotaria sp. Silwood1]